MIDFNIRRNSDWEDLSHLTQAAVSGGVTLCVEERGIGFPGEVDESGSLFCDLGVVSVVSPETLRSDIDLSGSLALKGYLTPPNQEIQPITDLEDWFRSMSHIHLPLIIDAAYVDSKTIYYSSPYRTLPLDSRLSDKEIDSGTVLAGAFCADSSSSSSGSKSSDDASAARVQYHRKRPNDQESATPIERKKSWGEETPTPQEPPKRKERRQLTSEHKKTGLPAKTKSCHNIFSALNEQILVSAASMESLMKAEMLAYQGVGKTSYKIGISKSTQLPVLEDPVETPVPAKTRGRRPPALTITPVKPVIHTESVYLLQLAQYPDSMETKGVERVISALQSFPCSVHISNLSSASAISRVLQARKEGLSLTCETCPHFLFFTDQSVADGDTRFKNFPPIRNSANCNFLWELLKMNAIDAVCSQHIPVSEVFKCHPSFKKAVSGINGIGFTLQVLWTLLKSPFTEIKSHEHYFIRLAKWTAYTPAKILGLTSKGSIAKGFSADFVVWDPFQEDTVKQVYSSQLRQCPYLGQRLYGDIKQVFVRGKLAYSQRIFHPVGQVLRRQNQGSGLDD